MISVPFLRSLLLVLLAGAMSVSAALPETQILPLRLYHTGRYAATSSRSYVSVPAGMVQLVMEQRLGGAWTRILVQDVTFAPKERMKSVFVTLPPKVPRSQLRIVGRRTALPVMLTPSAPVYERFEDAVDYAYSGGIVWTGGVIRADTVPRADSRGGGGGYLEDRRRPIVLLQPLPRPPGL